MADDSVQRITFDTADGETLEAEQVVNAAARVGVVITHPSMGSTSVPLMLRLSWA